MDFAAAGAALRVANVVGTVVEDAVVVHSASEPRRAVLSGQQTVVGAVAVPDALPVDAMVEQLGR